jgi:UDP-N-acetylglucosamine--N-acetylmuramyl-(pentapeptide) pyrophosphoryl-undecaprenol N-acetylglucosamine transferase
MSGSKNILVMAGGTGGHIFPGIAVAEYLKLEGWHIHWLGNASGMEYRITKNKGYEFEEINFGGLRGKGLKTKLMLPINLLKAIYQSVLVLRRVKPKVLLGMGGYITFPAGLIGAVMGFPLVLHEQNSIAGLANRVLAKFSKRALCAFPSALPNAEWVGNPLRAEVSAVISPAQRFATRTGNLNVLVVGGSLGATALNELVPKAIALIEPSKRPSITHQSGEKHVRVLEVNYLNAGVNATVVPFIENMAQAYSLADVVICRAGAMTVAELAACGVASLLVPFPFAVDDHQTSNAKFLAEAGAAVLIQQKDLQPENLSQWLSSLNREELLKMSEKALLQAKPLATARVAEVCMEVSSI